MSSLTPNYSFILPAVNDSVDANIWGTQLNTNFSNLDTDLKAVSNVANAASPSYGDLKANAGTVVPSGWLTCDGAAVSRVTYANLFTAIGITWGAGDTTTTFNVPDLGGRTLAGKEAVATRLTVAVSGVNGALVGATGGDQHLSQHTHTATQVAHTHTISFTSQVGFSAAGGGSPFVNNSATATTSSAQPVITVADAGTGTAANVQPTAVVLWLIYTGV